MGRAHYNGTDSKGEGNYNVYRAWKLSGIKGRHYHMVCWNLHETLQSRYMDTSGENVNADRWHGGPARETLLPVSLLRADLYSENLSTYLQSRLRVHEK